MKILFDCYSDFQTHINIIAMRGLLNTMRYLNSRQKIAQIPSLQNFMKPPPLNPGLLQNDDRLTFHIETYGCQMNVNDSEIVRAVLSEHYQEVDTAKEAEILLINTCAIREKAEDRIYHRIKQASKQSTIAILGCMAERLKAKMFKAGVQVVCGPDSYRDLPRLLGLAMEQTRGQMNVALSAEETYADIAPIRRNPSAVTAFLSIMRGCNNMCSFCIVPFVRGRQRSRNLDTILEQIGTLEGEGVREITFLGQNVNSYHDLSTHGEGGHNNSQGFGEMYKLRDHPGARFADLLVAAATKFPNIRFRFTSPHPKDFPEEVLDAISKYNNICKYVHLPAQSGNTEMLMKMRRNHTRESYIQLAEKMRKIPNMTLSTDMIVGFCGETEQQFQETISLMKEMKYQMAFLFAYSMREKTHAHRNHEDDVPEQVKQRRLKQMIDTFVEVQKPLNQVEVGKLHLLLLQGKAKRQEGVLMGKTDHYKNGYVKMESVPIYNNGIPQQPRQFKIGDYLIVRVTNVGPRSLYCKPIGIATTLNEFYDNQHIYEQLCPIQQESHPN